MNEKQFRVWLRNKWTE